MSQVQLPCQMPSRPRLPITGKPLIRLLRARPSPVAPGALLASAHACEAGAWGTGGKGGGAEGTQDLPKKSANTVHVIVMTLYGIEKSGVGHCSNTESPNSTTWACPSAVSSASSGARSDAAQLMPWLACESSRGVRAKHAPYHRRATHHRPQVSNQERGFVITSQSRAGLKQHAHTPTRTPAPSGLERLELAGTHAMG